jgi:regulator of protease activity HflC (stomatin/prohibitin superfamily)
MAWITVTIILAIVGFGALFVAAGSVGRARYAPLGVAAAAAVVWLVVTFFLCLHTVGQREIGIVYSFSGTITGKKDPGVVFTAPWQHIKTENVGIQSEEFDLDPNNAAVSRDQQPIYARLFVNFQVLPGDVVGLYKRVGPNWKHILLDARVLQDFKEITAQYQTPEITTHREDLRKQTRERLELELAPYDVKIVDVFLKNIGFSPAYTQAVEQKQVQVQQALQAQAKVAQSEAEARQRVAEARGEATAIGLKGRALRNNPEILRLEAIDKLNPNAQVVICTGRTCPAFLPSGLISGK